MAVIKPLNDKPKVFRVDRTGDELGQERNLLKKIFLELEKYEFVIGHNIAKFDMPFLKTRAMLLGVPFPHRPLIYDTLQAFKRTEYRTVLNGFGKPSAGLDMVIDLFGNKQRKTKIYPRHHWEIIWGSPSDKSVAMNDLVEHCVSDVIMNEEIFLPILHGDPNPTIKRMK